MPWDARHQLVTSGAGSSCFLGLLKDEAATHPNGLRIRPVASVRKYNHGYRSLGYAMLIHHGGRRDVGVVINDMHSH